MASFLGDITLGQFYPGDSFLHRLDPRSKLLSCLIVSTLFLLVKDPLPVAVLAGVSGVACAASGVPVSVYLRNLRGFWLLFGLTFAVHLLRVDLSRTWPFFRFGLVDGGAGRAGFYALRLGLLVNVAALLTLTTTPLALTDAFARLLAPLKRWRVPVHDFALMMTLALRFIPILLREAERIFNAQTSRGLAFQGGWLRRIRSVVPMTLPLLVSAIRRADEMAVSMTARNYDGRAPRTSYEPLRWTRCDTAVVLGTLALGAGTLWLGRLA